MNHRLILAFATAGLAACSTQACIDAFRHTEIQLEEARSNASIECSTSADCDRLWSLTKRYVARNSVTRIRRADDTAIETAMPHTFGTVYVWASRTADDSGGTTISIKGMCRGMYRDDGSPGWLYKSCAGQIRAVEMDFRSLIGTM